MLVTANSLALAITKSAPKTNFTQGIREWRTKRDMRVLGGHDGRSKEKLTLYVCAQGILYPLHWRLTFLGSG